MFFENCQKSRQQGLADEEWVGLREGASESTPIRERSTEWPIEEEVNRCPFYTCIGKSWLRVRGKEGRCRRGDGSRLTD
ncbi:hypothetical protein HZH66_014323 [Vespula vulgaris]|uniref:Uncharacterized protein n=1 Tax=Vespula vulgaris TaxID=7454 RepID=A0A834J3R1_VESVU|nr:hypothetical protein HZH66_014323 [Vespula vulgaris]